jgi:hypothetical protein
VWDRGGAHCTTLHSTTAAVCRVRGVLSSQLCGTEEEHTIHCMQHTAAVCSVRCVPSSQLCGTVEIYLGRWIDSVMAKWITGWMDG